MHTLLLVIKKGKKKSNECLVPRTVGKYFNTNHILSVEFRDKNYTPKWPEQTPDLSVVK